MLAVEKERPPLQEQIDQLEEQLENASIYPGYAGKDGADGKDGKDGADGRGIVSITKTSINGLNDTYTITYSDNTTSTFTVTNGKDGENATTTEVATTTTDGLMSAEDKKKLMYHINDDSVETTYLDIGIDDWSAGVHMTQSNGSNVVDIYGDEVTVNGEEIATTAVATATTDGLMSWEDKVKLDGMTGGTGAGEDGLDALTSNYVSTDLTALPTVGTTFGWGRPEVAQYLNRSPVVGDVIPVYGLLTDGKTSFVAICECTSTSTRPSWTFTYNNVIDTTGATGATGNGISSITKTSTDGLVDTYTITYTDGNTSTFTVTNGAQGADGLPALTYEGSAFRTLSEPAIGNTYSWSANLFNRIGTVGETFQAVICYDATTPNIYYNSIQKITQWGDTASNSVDTEAVYLYRVSGENATTTEVATTTTNGLMSASDKQTLDMLEEREITYIDLEYGSTTIQDMHEAGIVVNVDDVELEYSDGNNGNVNYDYMTVKWRLPILAGDNVTFTQDTENNVVKINATGGGSSLTMPIIRMGSATDTNNTMEISDDNPLTFTVEVIGGELQVGDELQLCSVRLFTYFVSESESRIRKYKMRQFATYFITEEDLSKHFISIAVETDVQRRELLRGGGTTTSTVHNYYTKYLRIRRPHPDNPDNNALFSNAVPFQVFGKWDSETTNSVGRVSIR